MTSDAPTPPRYHINVFWYPLDQCWVADVPDLRPCSAYGASPEQAVGAVRVKIEQWLAMARDTGQPVPRPCYSPALFAAHG